MLTLCGDGTIGSRDGLAETAQFNDPRGLAFDKHGNLYVAGKSCFLGKFLEIFSK